MRNIAAFSRLFGGNKKKSQESNITIYRTCDEMLDWNLDQYYKTHDLRWFTKEFVDHPDLHQAMTEFFTEYFHLTENTSIIKRFKLLDKVMKLEVKYNGAIQTLSVLWNWQDAEDMEGFKEHLSILMNYGYPTNTKKEIFSQLEDIFSRVQGIKTQIGLLNAQLQKEDIQEAESIIAQYVRLDRVLDMRYPLDPKTTTVAQRIAYQKEAREIIAERKKQQTHGRRK